MTVQEAYMSGFCKMAEANGISSEELMKFAELMEKEAVSSASFARVGKAFNTLGRASKGVSRSGRTLRRSFGRAVGGMKGGPTMGAALRGFGSSLAGLGRSTAAVPRAVGRDLMTIGRDAGRSIATGAKNMGNAAKSKAVDLGRKAVEVKNNTVNKIKNTSKKIKSDAVKGYKNVNRFLQKNPLATLGLGAGGGFALSKLTGSGSSGVDSNSWGARGGMVPAQSAPAGSNATVSMSDLLDPIIGY